MNPSDCVISAITLYELRAGALKSAKPERELKRVNLLAGTIRVLVFDPDTASAAAQVRIATQRKGRPIGPYDILIAAQALQFDLVMVTNNVREFERVPGLNVEDWRSARE